MPSHLDLLELGAAPDAAALKSRLERVAAKLGYGLSGGTLIRGRLSSGRAAVHSFGNHPEAFLEASRSLDNALRDPLMARLQAEPGCVVYDQQLYTAAGSADLWELQARFGYRAGMAVALHELSHAEIFIFGVDGDAVPTDPAERLRLEIGLRMVALHAQAAALRIYTPEGAAANALSDLEAESLRWAAGGCSVWMTAEKMSVSEAAVMHLQREASRKLGAHSVPMAVARAMESGFIAP
ncbi:MAG: hypothetical protein DI603_06335 [Roseateles depolymerans]|uniref:HTH luxR-type domain-containing protein n=1 Tax=Roseateles depolymerans TaxID=76731 RepID=A0A2W5FNL5_9BURK|nr:MAG: hypothetical protein DI603_06335 [Roseateles depolymerans]